jgi:hypothetical protein
MILNNSITRWAARRLAARFARIPRRPDFVIGGAENPYLLRWWLIPRNRWFNIYLHEFHRDDDDRAPHDHPWWSVSIALGWNDWLREPDGTETRQTGRGHMTEVYRDRDGNMQRRTIEPGSVAFRSAKFAHRLVVPQRGFRTIFITGPRIREWGFWCAGKAHGQPARFVDWRTFTSADKTGDSSRVGRGCE